MINAGRAWRAVDTAAGGRAADLGLYLIGAAFAGLTAATSTLAPHRAWGAVAIWAYAVAAAFFWSTRTRALVTALAWLGTAILPLLLQAAQRAGGRGDRAQEEVVVVEEAGRRLLDHGTPYLGRDAIAALPEAERLLGYVPYQPGMALFGLPRAVAGVAWWTDARVWFALATALALVLAVLALRSGPPLVRAVQAATVLPVCALTLATGGDDLPVLALCLLALALCARRRFAAAGVAAGLAGALKLFAWPVILVLLIHAWVAGGRAAAGRFAAGALGLPVLALLPAAWLDGASLAENVLRFPLGDGLVTSPAQSPLPGHLIATTLPAGRMLATILLLATGLGIAFWLLRRPPRAPASAALVCGIGLLAAILLMPSTRFGYLLYPAALLIWAPALARPEAGRGGANPPDGVHLNG